MLAQELLFSIYKCCFFARGRDAKRLRAELSFGEISGVKKIGVRIGQQIALGQWVTGPTLAPPSVFHGHN